VTNKVLCVDDEILVLSAFQRQLRKQFDISSALGGEQALKILATRGPFAVIVSDLKMAGMDGIQFLKRARDVSPDSVRIMLTGQADLSTATAAVNEGSIFRFLTKPCPADVLAQTLTAALTQHRLLVAEKDLLENTLRGAVKVLTEILSVVHPAVFGRSTRVRQLVQQIVAHLNLKDQWIFEVAALLSQIGCITLPVEFLAKACAGEELSLEERALFATHPGVGARLIRDIPRLELVGEMVARQHAPYVAQSSQTSEDQVEIGAQLLSVTLDYDQWLSRGLANKVALGMLHDRGPYYNPAVVAALGEVVGCGTRMSRKSARVQDLVIGMIAAEDVRCHDGTLLFANGMEISAPALECLHRFAAAERVREPIQMLYETEVPVETIA